MSFKVKYKNWKGEIKDFEFDNVALPIRNNQQALLFEVLPSKKYINLRFSNIISCDLNLNDLLSSLIEKEKRGREYYRRKYPRRFDTKAEVLHENRHRSRSVKIKSLKANDLLDEETLRDAIDKGCVSAMRIAADDYPKIAQEKIKSFMFKRGIIILLNKTLSSKIPGEGKLVELMFKTIRENPDLLKKWCAQYSPQQQHSYSSILADFSTHEFLKKIRFIEEIEDKEILSSFAANLNVTGKEVNSISELELYEIFQKADENKYFDSLAKSIVKNLDLNSLTPKNAIKILENKDKNEYFAILAKRIEMTATGKRYKQLQELKQKKYKIESDTAINVFDYLKQHKDIVIPVYHGTGLQSWFEGIPGKIPPIREEGLYCGKLGGATLQELPEVYMTTDKNNANQYSKGILIEMNIPAFLVLKSMYNSPESTRYKDMFTSQLQKPATEENIRTVIHALIKMGETELTVIKHVPTTFFSKATLKDAPPVYIIEKFIEEGKDLGNIDKLIEEDELASQIGKVAVQSLSWS